MPVNLRLCPGVLLQVRKRNASASAQPSGPTPPTPKKFLGWVGKYRAPFPSQENFP